MKDIMNMMDIIEYGFKENGLNILDNNPNKWENDFNSFYYLQTPEELLNSKCGVCWDQVELERYLFKNNNMSCKSYFVYISSNDSLPSHAFITCKDSNKYYWFEHSWAKYKGIHEYDTETELLKDVVSKFIFSHNDIIIDSNFFLYEYNKPEYHISCDEFYKYIETQKQIDINI